jgi:hypothetical protein
MCFIDADKARTLIKVGNQVVWRSEDAPGDMYQNEHNELIASIRAGKPINNGDYMTKSTLMAIIGRMATYTGQMIAWEKTSVRRSTNSAHCLSRMWRCLGLRNSFDGHAAFLAMRHLSLPPTSR